MAIVCVDISYDGRKIFIFIFTFFKYYIYLLLYLLLDKENEKILILNLKSCFIYFSVSMIFQFNLLYFDNQ